MSDSIYHMALKSVKNHIFWCENAIFCQLLRNAKLGVIM